MKKSTISNLFDVLSRKIISYFLAKNNASKLGFCLPDFSRIIAESQNSALSKMQTHNGVSESGNEGLFFSFRNLILFSSICFLFFSSQIFGQFAPVTIPNGGFAIDGGLRANTPSSPSPFTNNQGDWYPGTVAGATGGSVFNSSNGLQSPATAETSGRASGENFNGNDNIFTNGSKFNDYVSDLRWFTNSAPDKNDINNAMYHVARDGSNNQWIFISGDRLSTSGTSYIDFELLQGTIVQVDNGTFTGIPVTSDPNGFGGGRTKNDIIISMEYTNGGTKPLVYIYQWTLSGTKWSYQQITSSTSLLANAFAETNRTGPEFDVPYLPFGSNSYKQYAFVEAAVNITYLLEQSGLACSGLNIQTLWVKTKASASPTAALKDFIEPIPVDLEFGSTITIDPIQPQCEDNSVGIELSATPPGGSFSGTGVALAVPDDGKYYFTPSNADEGSNTITYISADGSCDETINIVVNALPTITGTLSVCEGSMTTLTGSATAASSNAWVSATPSVATISNTGVVTGVSAGTSVITYTNSNGCQITATVTVYALPIITGNSPICIDAKVQLVGSGTAASSSPWVSANTSVATVNITGEVTGVSAGSSVITYTNSNGCQITATVTVNADPIEPDVVYNYPLCYETTFSITIMNVVSGAIYTVTDINENAIVGISGLASGETTNYTGTGSEDNGDVTFGNFPVGVGYKVSVSNSGCGSSTSCGTPASGKIAAAPKEKVINDETPKAGFDAYPIPFKDQLNIKYKFDYKTDVKIEIFDLRGVLILSKTDTDSYYDKEIMLDFNFNVNKEQIYLVKVTTNKGSSVKKVISAN